MWFKNIIDSFSKMDAKDIILAIVSIVGTLVGIISYLDSRNSKKELKRYKYLFNIADKNIDKELTQAEIDRLHKEQKNMEQSIEELEKVIKTEIPLQAKKTVLMDRMKAEEEALSISYQRYNEARNEYKRLEQEFNINIPERLLKDIEKNILPDYLLKQKRQRYMSMLTILSYAAALINCIPILKSFDNVLILFTIYPLMELIVLYLPKDKKERRKLILSIIYNVSLALSYGFMVGSCILTLISNIYYADLCLIFFSVLSLILSIPKMISFGKKRKNKKE